MEEDPDLCPGMFNSDVTLIYDGVTIILNDVTLICTDITLIRLKSIDFEIFY